jgi:putative addiction module component (TIGR02574 family)
MTTAEILATAKKLKPEEQLFLIDSLFEMLDEPDAAVHTAWVAESQDRLAAYEKGEIKTAPIEQLIAKMRAV